MSGEPRLGEPIGNDQAKSSPTIFDMLPHVLDRLGNPAVQNIPQHAAVSDAPPILAADEALNAVLHILSRQRSPPTVLNDRSLGELDL